MRVVNYGELASLHTSGSEERFRDAQEAIAEVFTGLVDRDLIYGAFPFGSSYFGDATYASDIDIIIALQERGADAEARSHRAIHDASAMLYRQFGLPLEVTSYTRAQLMKGGHGLGDGMLAWLKQEENMNQQRVIGAGFVADISPRVGIETVAALAQVDLFAGRVRRTLTKAWLQGICLEPNSTLSLVLSMPHVLGRKSIDALQQAGSIPDKPLRDLSKSGVGEAVFQIYGYDKKLMELYNAISHDRELYTNELLPSAADLSEDEYQQIIETTLEEDLPKCIELVRCMQEQYHERYRRATIIRGDTADVRRRYVVDDHSLLSEVVARTSTL